MLIWICEVYDPLLAFAITFAVVNVWIYHLAVTPLEQGPLDNTRAKRLRMRKVSIFKLAVANTNFTTRVPVFELKSNFISIQNFRAGNVKPPGMHCSKNF